MGKHKKKTGKLNCDEYKIAQAGNVTHPTEWIEGLAAWKSS